MDLNILKIHSPIELIGKFNLSWGSTMAMTALTPVMDAFLPVITQLTLLILSQVFIFFVDWARLKYLADRRKSTIEQVKNEISVKDSPEDEK